MARQSIPQSRATMSQAPNMSTPDGPAYAKPPSQKVNNRMSVEKPQMSTPRDFKDNPEYKPPEDVMSRAVDDMQREVSRKRNVQSIEKPRMSKPRGRIVQEDFVGPKRPKMSVERSRAEMDTIQDRGFYQTKDRRSSIEKRFTPQRAEYSYGFRTAGLGDSVDSVRNILGTEQTKRISDSDLDKLQKMTTRIEGASSYDDIALTSNTENLLDRARNRLVAEKNPEIVEAQQGLKALEDEGIAEQARYLNLKINDITDSKFVTDQEAQVNIAALASPLKNRLDEQRDTAIQMAEGEVQERENFKQNVGSFQTGGRTFKEIIEDPASRERLEDEYLQQNKKASFETGYETGRDSALDLELYGYLLNKKQQQEQQEVQNQVTSKIDNFLQQTNPQTRTVTNDQGQEVTQYIFDSEEKTKEYKDLVQETNKKLQNKFSNINKEYSNYYDEYQQAAETNPEIDKIWSGYEKGVEQYNQLSNKLRMTDEVEFRKAQLQDRIDEDRYGSGSIIPTIQKGVGGFGLDLVQGYAVLPSLAKRSAGKSDPTLVGREEGQKLLDEFGIDSQEQQATESLVTTGAIGLAGAPGVIGTVAAGTVGEAAKRIDYATSSEQQQEIMSDSGTFREGVRAGLASERENVKSGWGGSFGGVRSFASEIPGLSLVSGVGSKDSFEQGVREYYKNQGYSGQRLQNAVKAATGYRNSLEAGEIGAVLGGNTAAELVGRRSLSKAFTRGALSPKMNFKDSLTASKKLIRPGAIEGSIVAQAQADSQLRDIDLSERSEAAFLGSGSAFVAGMGLTGTGLIGKTGVPGKIGRFVSKGTKATGYITDPFEYLGDLGATGLEKTFRSAARYTGRVRPKSFVMQRTSSKGSEDVNLNVKDVAGITRTDDGNFKITKSGGDTLLFANNQQNAAQIAQMTDYVNKELQSVSPEGLTRTQSQVENNQMVNQDVLNREKTVSTQPQSNVQQFIDSQTKPESLAQAQSQTQTNVNARVQPQAQTQTQTQTNVNARSQTSPFAQAQSTAQTNVFAGNAGFPFPYGRVQLGKSYPGFQIRQGVQQFLKENQIQDYATKFFKTSGKTDAERAKSAVNRLFGKNTASGEQFKKNNGGVLDNTPKKNSNIRSKVFGSKKK